MDYIVSGRTLVFSKDIRGDAKRRKSFDALAQKTFGLSFKAWHKAGYWTDKYIPYTLSDENRVVANVSVNLIDTRWQGEDKRYIQLGGVMTHPRYRGLGLSRFLMDRALVDWKDNCDAIYLYANDSVLDFYPRFGFVPALEYTATLPATPRPAPVRRLDMGSRADIALLLEYYEKKGNPHCALPMLDNPGLVIFYCAGPLKDCVYYLEDTDAVVVADKSGGGPLVYDVFCDGRVPLEQVVNALVDTPCTAQLGFAWQAAPVESLLLREEEDTTMFVLDGRENLFTTHKTMLPLLSHA